MRHDRIEAKARCHASRRAVVAHGEPPGCLPDEGSESRDSYCRTADSINENQAFLQRTVRYCTPNRAIVWVIPEVVDPRFSRAIAGRLSWSRQTKHMKASHKWLAFNDFHSGGLCRPRVRDCRGFVPAASCTVELNDV